MFEELVNNIEGLHPDPEVNKLIHEYKESQLQIDRMNQGYLE